MPSDEKAVQSSAKSPDAFAAECEPPRIDQYELVEVLGRGGMGTVYRAFHKQLKRSVAIKTLARSGGQGGEHERFFREMEVLGQLDHPRIVRALDAGLASGVPYLIMEYVDGADLQRICDRIGPLPTPEACEVVRQVSEALSHAHQHGLVHRDVKPSNILLSSKGEVKLADLGLARWEHHRKPDRVLTGTHVFLGSVDYCSPEQIDDSKALDGRSDLYSLGCTLYRMLCGQPPFSGPKFDSVLKKLDAHRREQPEPILAHRPDLPVEVIAIVEQLLMKSPDERFSSADQLAVALAPFSQGANLRALIESCPVTSPTMIEVGSAYSGNPRLETAIRAVRPHSSRVATIARHPVLTYAAVALILAALLTIALANLPQSAKTASATPSAMTPVPAAFHPPSTTTEFAEEWIAALGEKPSTLIWPGRRGRQRFVLDNSIRMLTVAADYPVFVRFGDLRTDQRGWLRIRVERGTSFANGGIFWNYHEPVGNQDLVAVTEVVRTRSHLLLDGTREWRLHRMTVRVNPETAHFEPLADKFVPIAAPNQQSIEVELHFEAGQVRRIVWDGTEYFKLVEPSRMRPPAGIAGPWGGFAEQGEMLFDIPQIQLTLASTP